MLEDFRLRVFVKLAAEKNFTRAAEALGVSQPAVSQNISELEKQYNVKFFERLRGSVELTPAGEIFLERAKDILQRYSDISLIFTGLPEALVRVYASDEIFSYLTGTLLNRFMKIHPEVNFVLTSDKDDADLLVSLAPSNEKRGMLALSYHPSVSFASSRLYRVLLETIQPSF